MAEASAKRVTGDESQGTMGRVQTAGEATSRPLSSSRLPLRAHFHEKTEVWVRGSLCTMFIQFVVYSMRNAVVYRTTKSSVKIVSKT